MITKSLEKIIYDLEEEKQEQSKLLIVEAKHDKSFMSSIFLRNCSVHGKIFVSFSIPNVI